MKKRSFIYMLIAFTGVIMMSCSSSGDGNKPEPPTPPGPPTDNSKEKFMAKSEYGAYNVDIPFFEFAPLNHQLAFNTTKRSFRLQNDDQTKYFGVTLAAAPVADKDVKASFISEALMQLEPGEKTVTVVKIAAPKVWLWNNTTKQGFIIRLE